MPKSETPRKARKPREKDPVKLVTSRGLNMEERWQPITDENGNKLGKEKVMTVAPKGVVLAPVQTMMLASYIQQLHATLELALADDDEDDD